MTVIQYKTPATDELVQWVQSDLEDREPIVPLVEMDEELFLFPKVDILENKEHFVLRAELPGFDKKDLDVVVENNVLTLKAERRPESGQKFHYRERPMGSFTRRFQLSNRIGTKGIRAVYRDGILSVYLPKMNQQKEIKIQ